jgi:hypothetical protein
MPDLCGMRGSLSRILQYTSLSLLSGTSRTGPNKKVQSSGSCMAIPNVLVYVSFCYTFNLSRRTRSIETPGSLAVISCDQLLNRSPYDSTPPELQRKSHSTQRTMHESELYAKLASTQQTICGVLHIVVRLSECLHDFSLRKSHGC